MNRKLIISSSSSSVLLCYYEERCLGARSERLFLKRTREKTLGSLLFRSFFFRREHSQKNFISRGKREKEKEERYILCLSIRFLSGGSFRHKQQL